MNILFITEFFPQGENLNFTGGVESYNYYLIKELAKRNNVIVICQKRAGFKKAKVLKNIKIISAGLPISRFDTSILTLPNRIIFLIHGFIIGLNLNFDLVQGNNFVTYFLAYFLGLIKGKPKIAWYPDVFVGDWKRLVGNLAGFIGEFIEKIYLRLNWSKVIALSESTKNKLIKQGLNKEEIPVVYGGVDLDFFKFNKETVKNEIFTIVTISRLVKYKQVEVLVKAVEVLIKRGLKVHLKIVGHGPEQEGLINYVKKNSLNNEIGFYSNITRDEVKKILQTSHLFCLPSIQEGFGLVVIEAAACGLPYVVSDIPVLKEITRGAQGGKLFKPKNVLSLAGQIEKVYRNKKLRRDMSVEALKLARIYSWTNIAKQFEKIYQELLVKKIRILMLVDAWFPLVGGGQIHAWELSKQLVKGNYEVIILTRNLGNWEEEVAGITVKRIGNFKSFSNLLGRLEYLIQAFFYSLICKYDILHAHAFSPGLIVPLVKLFKRVPAVFTAHGKGMKISGLPFGEKFLENLVFYTIKYEAIITVAKETFSKKVTSPILEVIPNGVDVVRFRSAQRVRNKISRLLYIGRLNYDKGVDLLLDAYKKLPKRFSLTVVGDGPEKTNLQRQAKGSKVNFEGLLLGEDLVAEIKRDDLLILPSRVEGQPLRLLEAWAAKIPVLATKTGDNSQLIKDGENGFLVEVSSDAIRNRIIELSNYNLERITDSGYKKVLNFSWEEVAKKTARVYERILNV